MSGLLPHRRKAFRQVAPANFDGFGNKSRSFNGVDDYIATANDVDVVFGSTFTIAFWLKLDDGQPASTQQFFGVDNGTDIARILVTNGGVVRAVYRSDNGIVSVADLTASLTNGQQAWVHYAWVVTPTGQKIYVDGLEATLDGTNDGDMTGITMGNFNTLLNFYIGVRNFNGSADQFTAGNYADFRMYDTDLSSTDIADLYSGTNITTNLVGHWLKDTDDLLDHSVNSNNGENFGSIFSPDNPSPAVEFGRASRSFNGSSDYIDLGNVLDNVFTGTGKQWSFTAWVKADTLNDRLIFSKWHNTLTERAYFIRILSSGDLGINLSSDGTTNNRWGKVTNTSPINANTWHHVAVSYDQTATGNYIRLWVDGVEDTNLTDYLQSGTFTSIYDGNATIQISGINGTNSQDFDGKIADVRIYDTDLTASQILDLYNGTDVQTNLIGHWLTDNDDVEDKAGTNDGTNFGSTYSYDAPFTEATLPNHYWDLSDTGTYADSGKLASAGWDLSEYSSVNSSVQNIGTSTKTVLDTTNGGLLEYKNGTNVSVGWDSESKEISMACWFYCTTIQSTGNWLISWRGNNSDNRIAQIFVRQDSGLQIFRGALFDAQGNVVNTPQSGTSIALNTWYHGAMTWDKTTMRTYINGELFGTGTNASVDGLGTNAVGCEFAIGGASWQKTGGDKYHAGYTFGAGVWDVALTENQIKALYNDGNALDYSETTWR